MSTSDLEERPSDPLVAPVAVDAHPQGHAVVLQSHSRDVIAFQVSKNALLELKATEMAAALTL